MSVPYTRLAVVALALVALVAACGPEEAEVTEPVEDIEDIEDVDDAQQAADEAWANFRTEFERIGDELVTDEAAQEELADACRDALAELREADDPRADQLEAVCDDIRDADAQAEWNALQEELDRLDTGG